MYDISYIYTYIVYQASQSLLSSRERDTSRSLFLRMITTRPRLRLWSRPSSFIGDFGVVERL